MIDFAAQARGVVSDHCSTTWDIADSWDLGSGELRGGMPAVLEIQEDKSTRGPRHLEVRECTHADCWQARPSDRARREPLDGPTFARVEVKLRVPLVNDPERTEQLVVKPIDETEVGADFDGQEPARELYDEPSALGVAARLIGGADEAASLTPPAPSPRAPSWRWRCSVASPTTWRPRVDSGGAAELRLEYRRFGGRRRHRAADGHAIAQDRANHGMTQGEPRCTPTKMRFISLVNC